jgi:hypothetical protein
MAGCLMPNAAAPEIRRKTPAIAILDNILAGAA